MLQLFFPFCNIWSLVLLQDENIVTDYIGTQPDLNAKMRSILIDWLIEVHRKFELMPETLYLTVNIVDRFLSLKTVPRRELQLVGVSSMLIACKYEEIWAPEVYQWLNSKNTNITVLCSFSLIIGYWKCRSMILWVYLQILTRENRFWWWRK